MTYRHDLRVELNSLSTDAYEELCRLAPSARTPYGFYLQFDTDSADGGTIVRQIAALCALHGLIRRMVPCRGAYGYCVERRYGDDLLSAELLYLPAHVICRTGVKDGRFVSHYDPAYTITAALGFEALYAVREDVRQALEGAGFVGLEFGDVPLKGDRANADRQRFFELKSTIVMPRMSNTHQFLHPHPLKAQPFKETTPELSRSRSPLSSKVKSITAQAKSTPPVPSMSPEHSKNI